MDIIDIISKKPFAVVGHRGAKGRKPENTLAAIEYAIKVGADIVEVDVRQTKDSELILLHDRDFKRLTGRAFIPSQLSYDFIKENITIDGEPIASLKDAIKTVGGKAGLFVEIKEPETTEKVVETVISYNAEKWVGFISFFEEALIKVKEINPQLKTGLIYMKPPGKIYQAKKINCEFVLSLYRLSTGKAVNFAHRLNLKVVSWVINDYETAKLMHSRGIDAIASDYPDLAVKWKEKIRGSTPFYLNAGRHLLRGDVHV
ncbi:MAG: glycerophosphodiester phosphodiesterase [Persephonella sp.]|nr:glycerophosphodiester phosphodiesterase [Persephonella sp.]